jgi:hypothetical protein
LNLVVVDIKPQGFEYTFLQKHVALKSRTDVIRRVSDNKAGVADNTGHPPYLENRASVKMMNGG